MKIELTIDKSYYTAEDIITAHMLRGVATPTPNGETKKSISLNLHIDIDIKVNLTDIINELTDLTKGHILMVGDGIQENNTIMFGAHDFLIYSHTTMETKHSLKYIVLWIDPLSSDERRLMEKMGRVKYMNMCYEKFNEHCKDHTGLLIVKKEVSKIW